METGRVRVRNNSSTAAKGVHVSDILPGGMSLASTSKGASFAKGRVTWTIRTLAARATRTVTVKVRIDRAIGGLRCNTASASASNAGTVRKASCVRIRAVAGAAAPAVAG